MARADSPGERPAYRRLWLDAVALLEGWQPPDAEQEVRRADFLAHLAEHADAMCKHGPAAHLTASCLVLDETGDHALLTHHRRARQWYQFGGHFEPEDSDAHGAATREAREESGITDLTPLPGLVHLARHELHGDFSRCREHLDLRYVAVAVAGAAHHVSEESLDVRWWPVDALPADTREDLLPLVRLASAVVG